MVDEVKNQVDAITTFPVETEKPIVRELIARNQVTDISISGNTDVFTLKAIAERVRDELSVLPEITQVDIVSAPPYEISIEVSETALRRHGMTFDQVADAVRRSSLDLPGGSVRTDGGEILLRTIGQAYRGNEYEDLVLWTQSDGSRLQLGDVATVVDGFAETDQQARFDRDTTVMVSVFRTGDQSALDIATAVHGYVERTQPQMPEGILLTIWQDQAEILSDRLTLMLRNGATGFALVFVVLALFLELRLAFWVSLGIPLSFLGAIALMPGFDVSANVISLFAFILVLGIVVDDAIIVGENIYRHQEEHGDGMRGSIEGAREIAKPVVFAVLTTVAAFMPLMFVPGMMGKISDSFRAGKVEMQLGIKPAAETLGLTLQDLGRQVRQAFYGEEAQRIQRGRDDIRVMVRYPRDDRRSLGDLENMRIRTPNGAEVPFGQVAQVEPGRGFASILSSVVVITRLAVPSETSGPFRSTGPTNSRIPTSRSRSTGGSCIATPGRRERFEAAGSRGEGPQPILRDSLAHRPHEDVYASASSTNDRSSGVPGSHRISRCASRRRRYPAPPASWDRGRVGGDDGAPHGHDLGPTSRPSSSR